MTLRWYDMDISHQWVWLADISQLIIEFGMSHGSLLFKACLHEKIMVLESILHYRRVG